MVALAAVARGPNRRSGLALLPLGAGVAAVVAGIVAGSNDANRLHLAVSNRPSEGNAGIQAGRVKSSKIRKNLA